MLIIRGAAWILVLAALLVGCAMSAPQHPESPFPTGSETHDPSELAYATSGYQLHAADPRPYSYPESAVTVVVPLTNDTAAKTVDARGVLQVSWPGYAEPIYHPVSIASYGLNSLTAYEWTGNPEYLRRAQANAQALIDGGDEVGTALWFPYAFEYSLHGDPEHTLSGPWWSGMAQGQALSLFSRLAEGADDPAWRRAADQVFETYSTDRSHDAPWFTDIGTDGHVWFEEYAGNIDPTQVVNGHIYAMFGLADYYELTGIPEALDLFDGGATTIRETFDDYRNPGQISFYCAAQFCKDGQWQPASYHRGVRAQLRTLAQMTDDPTFTEYADLFTADYVASGEKG